jgi:2-hydroxy-3-oxopropionate reductase
VIKTEGGLDVKKIGMIGIGNMGKPMAMNLLRAGYPLTVYDINPRAVEEVVAAGG